MIKQMDGNIRILSKALDGIWLKDKVIKHNMANVNTPNYKRLTVDFEDKLRSAMENHEAKLNRTNDKHFPTSNSFNDLEPKISIDKSYSYRFDKNNVNVDTESAELAKNSIMYNVVVNQIANGFESIKNVINEGSK